VTGSFGKTTSARAIVTALGGQPRLDIGRNAKIFVARALLRIKRGQRHAVIEIGIMGPNEMAGYARIARPDIAVVTSIGSEHNRALASLEVTRDEKAHLVRVLPASGAAVLNGDDPNVLWMRDHTRARIRTFGFGEANDVRAGRPVLDWPRGMRFSVRTPAGTREARVQLMGRPMVYPILAAVTVALEEGVSLDRALEALATLEPTPGRLQPVPLANGAILLRDDFKSAQETIEAALDLLGEIPAKRRIVVLGDVSEPVGAQGPIYRHLGQRVAEVASRAVFLTGNNVSAYIAGGKKGGLAPEAMIDAHGRVKEAIEALKDDLGPGDVVLIKGRDTQHLARVAIGLAGRKVGCELTTCDVKLRCEWCPMLEQGWGTRSVRRAG
jgi:UDP-N-acetylmuramoyl-tripeptide--D-alanyl-D-alanine ligase